MSMSDRLTSDIILTLEVNIKYPLGLIYLATLASL